MPRRRQRSDVPRRKVKRIRHGASVSLYLDFFLLERIREFAEREQVNFNDACREILYIATDVMKPSRQRKDSPTSQNTRKP